MEPLLNTKIGSQEMRVSVPVAPPGKRGKIWLPRTIVFGELIR